jgi:hypothetical protein
VLRRIDDEQAEWVSRPTALGLLVLPLVGAVVVVVSAAYRPLFRLLTREDRVLEWIQFFGLVAGVVLGAVVAVLLWRSGRRLPAVLWGLFALGCFFVAGEEIAWGQRILGLETPERLADINHQEEITVHNISDIPVQTVFNGLFALLGFCGSVVAVAVRGRGRDHPLVDLLAPPAALFNLFFLGFLYRALRLLFFPEPRFLVVKYGEFPEACLSVGLGLFAFLVWRRVRREVGIRSPESLP